MPGQEEGEELFGEDDEEYTGSSASDEDEDFPPISKQLQKSASSNTTTRKKIDVDVFSDSSEEDEELAYLKSIGPSKHDKVKELISRQKIKSKEPISILKKASKYSPKISTKSTELPKKVSSKASKTQLKKEISTHIRPGSKKAGSKLTGILKTTTEASGVISSTVDHFFDEILEWDLYSSLKKEFQKESDGSGSIGEEDEEIIKVPSQFRSYDHYFSVWKPLALQEVRAQALNGIMTDRPVAVHIKAKAPAGSFLAGTCKIRLDHKQRLSSHQKDHLNSLFSNDLVLLTPTRDYFDRLTLGDSNKSLKKHTKNNHDKKQQSNKRSEIEDSENSPEALMPPKSVLGIVNSQKSTREGLLIRVLSASWRTIDQEEDLYLFKVSNLITSVREFRALCDCKDYNLMPLLLSGHHKQGSMQLDTLGIEYVRWLQRTFNESQLEAITAAATSHGFTLIKGPPGTGKTTTLKGLLNSLHLREYSCYYNAVLDVARRPDHETEKAWAAIGNEKPHILVTAPSNAAVDNIVGKVMEEGFCDGEGRRYFPQIVRVGRGLVSLDQFVIC
jgi:senataxin